MCIIKHVTLMFSSNAGLFTAKLFFKEKLSEVVHIGPNLVFKKL